MTAPPNRLPYRATPYYEGLIDPADPRDPIAIQVTPDPREEVPGPGLVSDPLAEEAHSPLPGLIRRFPDRALILAHGDCPVHCRHCFRRHRSKAGPIPAGDLKAILSWLRVHPEVREILVSGGEPLLLGPVALGHLLGELRALPSIRWLRLATRMPVVDPDRVTPKVVAVLANHGPLHLATHFNHPRELTSRARAALDRLVDAGIPVWNQAVLLRGVNDDEATLEALFTGLVEARVHPYYLFQGDRVAGTDHLRVSTARALDLIEDLRSRISGLALPTLAVDHPDASSKIILDRGSYLGTVDGITRLRAPDGRILEYPEPAAP